MRKIIFTFLFTVFLAGISSVLCYGADGWRQERDEWYYYDGSHMRTGWIREGGQTYYLGADGRMVTGWCKIDGDWYLFRADGAMHRGWWMENGSWYYLKQEDGVMLADKTGPDGHRMNGTGIWDGEAVDGRAEVLELTGQLPYILNWDTDSRGGFVSEGVCELAVIKSLLGMHPYESLTLREKELCGVVKAFIDSEIQETDSDYEKIVKVTAFLWDRAEYAAGYQGGAYGILVEGKGVCEGYGNAFKLIVNALGLECYKVESGYYNHVWNIVKVDGEWYHADLTEPAGAGYPASEAPYILRNDSDYLKSQYKTGYSIHTPDCKGTRYTESNLRKGIENKTSRTVAGSRQRFFL